MAHTRSMTMNEAHQYDMIEDLRMIERQEMLPEEVELIESMFEGAHPVYKTELLLTWLTIEIEANQKEPESYSDEGINEKLKVLKALAKQARLKHYHSQ
jgi:hypothetical protein